MLKTEKLRDKADQLEGRKKPDDQSYSAQCSSVKGAYQALSNANFYAGALVDELQNVISDLEDAHEALAELSKTIGLENDRKANDKMARKSAFY
ncbi:MAG: hypothetical protein ABI668_13655 [Sphingorhabdus sp.]